MNTPHLSLLFAGLLGLTQCALTMLVIGRRVQAQIILGDGGDEPLLRRISAQANFSETVPIALLLMLLLELRGLHAGLLLGLGCTLLLGRWLHAAGLLSPRAKWARVAGMAMTVAVISVQAVMCVWTFCTDLA